ncbi:3-epi-6-deoxocathasterone 23-monooxygenase-like protein [Trifolium pratense]|uniref:3-epi-6-deoxocathasterone 23-monooxygenase-like protein n=1 Tax=Trifolium pratense TaxID=57577 RepID=A0A2K3NQG0_TRIPR|nr:3-epi-6-deoxocathasterone 23-monooxygenase-like protein [Trifolium pratense]
MSWWWIVKKESNIKVRKGIKIPKGNAGWPLVGETLEFIASGYSSHPVTFFENRKSIYGNVFKSNILGSNIIVSTDSEVNKITFTILIKVLMSVGPGEDLELLRTDFGEFIKGLICLPIKFPGTRLYKSLKAKERMMKIVRRIVDERKKLMMNNNAEDQCILDALLRDNKGKLSSSNPSSSLALERICQNIIVMMIPGEETLATAMTLALKFLSDTPLVLTKLMEEHMELKKLKAAGCSNDYTWTDHMALPFTQNVISETLRMAHVVNGIWRKALKDVEIKGYLIPKGWCVMASLTSVHLDANNYENPFKFDPWRWEKIEAVTSNNCFTPFGGGQRLCPGLDLSRVELSIFLHHLVTTHRWVAERDEIIYFPIVKMKKKLPIRVQPINA